MSSMKFRSMEPIRLEQFLKTRREEIASLKEQIERSNGNKLAFQRLPRYMRRRQMSHNTKRLPKRLREIDIVQKLKSRPEKQSLKVLRRYCRRRLKKRFVIRGTKPSARWLETHVWHAKRFRMVTKWRFRLAERSYEKTFRKCYRSTDRGCFAHDASYTNCFELCGPRSAILQPLDTLTDSRTNWLFSDARYANGSLKGSATIFEPNRYPFKAIGPISFVWLPANDDDNDDDDVNADNNIKNAANKIVRFWFWTHAAFAQSICNRFRVTFELDPITLTNAQTKVSLMDFVQKVNVFRLIGPKSLELLKDVLKIPLIGHPNTWFQTNVIYRPRQLEKLYKQKDLWKQIKTLTDPLHLATNQVLNLTVLNPQYVNQTLAAEKLVTVEVTRPTNVNVQATDVQSQSQPQSQSSIIEIVDESTNVDENPPSRKRKRYSSRFVSKHKSATTSTRIEQCGGFFQRLLRSKEGAAALVDPAVIRKQKTTTTTPVKERLVGGETPELRKNATVAVVPIMIVQRAGNRVRRYRNVGYGAGFDLFVPATWGRTFWHCFHLRRVCMGGLRAINSLAFERGLLSPFAPDTVDGRAEHKQIGEQLTETYFRRPPKCRPNFRKLNIPAPFQVDWSVLLQDWQSDENFVRLQNNKIDFYVLRNKVLLERLNNSLCKTASGRNARPDVPDADRCLIPVRLRAINSKGMFGRLTMICLPTSADYNTGSVDDTVPQLLETPKPDANQRIRKQLRLQHRRQLKRFRKLRKREKRRPASKQNEEVVAAKCDEPNEPELIVIDDSDEETEQRSIGELYKDKMRSLWLNTSDKDTCLTYRYRCQRQIMGFVETGDFAMRSGHGAGIGYVTAHSLFKLIERRQRPQSISDAVADRTVFVWARNRHTLQYRRCSIDIVPFDNTDL